jgi:predicted nucleotidyltransferase
MTTARIEIPFDEIAAFCRKWKITELALFGSVLCDDFGPDSDIDVLFTLAPGVHWPWGGFAGMTDDLEQIFGRKVDLGSRRGVEEDRNPIRRRHILSSLSVIYRAE